MCFCFVSVTMAKGMGNGFPIGAVVTTPEIAKVMGNALHFNTFGGNPLACAVGNSVIDVSLSEICKCVGDSLSHCLSHSWE